METDLDTVKIWTDEVPEFAGKSALPGLARAAVAKTVEVSGEVLRDGIKEFAAQFAALLDGAPVGDGGVVIDEVELSLTVTATGGLELLGKVSLGTQAAIRVKLKRTKNELEP